MKYLNILLILVFFLTNPISKTFAVEEAQGTVNNLEEPYEYEQFLPLVMKPEPSWINTSSGMEYCGFSDIVFSPNFENDQMVFAVNSGGFNISKDGGVTWELSNTGLNYYWISKIIISPNFVYDHTIFLQISETGADYFAKSTDSGNTWNMSDRFIYQINDIVISPNFAVDSTLIAAFGNGINKSIDGGDSWQIINNEHNGVQVIISPNFEADQTMFTRGFNNISRSLNGGESWESLLELDGTFEDLAISPNFPVDQTIFALVRTFDSNKEKIIKSKDAGNSWEQVSPNYDPASWGYIIFSPNYFEDNTLFYFETRSSSYDPIHNIYKSSDRGETWIKSGQIQSGNTHAIIKIAPNFKDTQKIYGSSREGFYFSLNGGESWKLITNKIYGIPIADIAISPNFEHDHTLFSIPGVLYTTRNTVYKSIDKGLTWSALTLDDAEEWISINSIAISPNYSNDKTIFAGGFNSFYKSSDGGISWIKLNPGLEDEYGDIIIWKIAFSPNYKNDHTIFAGTSEGMLRSKDGGNSWQKLDTSSFYLNNAMNIAISPNFKDDQTLIAGTDLLGDGLARSTDGGDTWSLVLPGGSSPDIIWDEYSNAIFYPQCASNLFRSNNSGENWFIYDYSPWIISSLATHFINESTIYLLAGTERAGVQYRNIADGSVDQFKPMNNGIGILSITSLAIFEGTSTILYAGTPAGIWVIEIFD